MESRQHLRLVFDSEEELISFDRPPFSLRAQPQRPGELTELVDVVVDEGTLARVEAESPVLLPRELALFIAIEAERALREAAALVDVEVTLLADQLDEEASGNRQRGPRHVLVRPLEEYVAAVEAGLERRADRQEAVRARVPHHVAARWAQSAAASGKSLEHWLSEMLEGASGGRVAWEVTAARDARALGEWVLVQAVRWARPRRTLPQTRASG